MRRRSKRRTLRHDDTDPASLVSNLFDVAMVFAVALMVALVTKFSMTEMLTQEDFTIIKNPGKDNMEIISKKGSTIERYTPTDSEDASNQRRGKRVGIAYELENGEVIYIPEE